jgi:hypothetical protein
MLRNITNSLRVIIYGTWASDWMESLGPQASLWINHPNVKEVVVWNDVNNDPIPQPRNSEFLTVILPLMEWHIIKSPKNYYSLTSDEKIISTLGIKDLFANYMQEIGLSSFCPERYLSLSTISYPAILKRVNKNGSNGIALVNTESDLVDHLNCEPWKNQNILIQEAITSDKEFVYHLVCKDGRIYWASCLCYRLINSHSIKNENSLLSTERVTTSPNLLTLFERILKPLNFNGPCNIDFRFNSAGNLKILEINPRLGGSLMKKENADLLKEAINQILTLALIK